MFTHFHPATHHLPDNVGTMAIHCSTNRRSAFLAFLKIQIGRSPKRRLIIRQAGTLRIDGDQSAANGSVQVSSGAILAGNGISGGPLTLFQGAILGTTLRDWTAANGNDRLQVASLNTGGLAPTILIQTADLLNFHESPVSFTLLNAPGGIAEFDPTLAIIQAPGFPGTGSWSLARSDTTLTLHYQAPVTDPYLLWAATQNLSGDDAHPAADPDHDSIPNLIEFVIGGDPSMASDLEKLPTATLDNGDFLVTYRRRTAAAALETAVEFSTMLGTDWTAARHAVDGIKITLLPDGFATGIDRIEVRLPAALSSDGKLFVRLAVTRP